jgi:hypothetical protein
MQMSRRARTCSQLRHRKCGAHCYATHTGAFPLSRASQPSFVALHILAIGTRRARTADLKTHKSNIPSTDLSLQVPNVYESTPHTSGPR